MALLDDLAKGGAPAGLVAGIGAVLLTPVLFPLISSALRPAAKTVMRTGITIYRQTMEPLAAAVSSLVTEAQLELAASSDSQGAQANPNSPEASAPPRQKRRGTHK